MHPSKWTPEEVRLWITNIDGGRFASAVSSFPSRMDGKQLSRLTPEKISILCDDKQIGKAFYKVLRRAMKAADAQKAEKREANMKIEENARYERW